jgi:hypothetical protein
MKNFHFYQVIDVRQKSAAGNLAGDGEQEDGAAVRKAHFRNDSKDFFRVTIYDAGTFTSPRVAMYLKGKRDQGCQIFLRTKYQNGKNIPNFHELYQMSIKYNKRP